MRHAPLRPPLAGWFDPRRGVDDRRWDRIGRALGGRFERAVDDGPLAVGATTEATVAGGSMPAMALDGRILNAPALAAALGLPGEPALRSLLASAWRRWGPALVEELRGEFALVVWDGDQQRGVIACDQLGGRSVFLHGHDDRFAFASEVGTLVTMLPQRPPPSDAAIASWLIDSEPGPAGSFYAGIRRLPAATVLELSAGGARERRYWRPVYRPPQRRTRSEWSATLREAVVASVRLRLSETGDALLLSGGLDSASVAGAARAAGATLPAYSAVFPGSPEMDESELIDDIAQTAGLPSTKVEAQSGSVIAGALEYTRDWDVPASVPNHFLWRRVLARAAEAGAAVIWDGEGGDEMFGVSPYLIADRVRRARPRAALALARRLPGAGDEPSRDLMRWLVKRYAVLGALPPRLERTVLASRGRTRHTPAWLSEHTLEAYLAHDERGAWKLHGGPRWWSWKVELLTRSRAAMGVQDHFRRQAGSIGLRDCHPFLNDLGLVELALSWPPELDFDAHLSRPLLRDAMAGIVPDSVRLRAGKTVFNTLMESILSGSDRPRVVRLLEPRDARVYDWVERDSVARELLAATAPLGVRDQSRKVWRLVALEIWLRSQDDPSFTERANETIPGASMRA